MVYCCKAPETVLRSIGLPYTFHIIRIQRCLKIGLGSTVSEAREERPGSWETNAKEMYSLTFSVYSPTKTSIPHENRLTNCQDPGLSSPTLPTPFATLPPQSANKFFLDNILLKILTDSTVRRNLTTVKTAKNEIRI